MALSKLCLSTGELKMRDWKTRDWKQLTTMKYLRLINSYINT